MVADKKLIDEQTRGIYPKTANCPCIYLSAIVKKMTTEFSQPSIFVIYVPGNKPNT